HWGWLAARLEVGGGYFAPLLPYGGDCRAARPLSNDRDARTMSGYATLGPGLLLGPQPADGQTAPYVHLSAGGRAAKFDGASPGLARYGTGTIVGASVGCAVPFSHVHIAPELRWQWLAPVLGVHVRTLGLAVGIMP